MTDNFQGDNAKLIECIESLLHLDAAGSLAPHGVGNCARTLLEAAASRLQALSHAAGQDGEQCRAASGEPVAWIRSDGVTTSDAGLMRHWEAQELQFDPLILALSRGVPEGK